MIPSTQKLVLILLIGFLAGDNRLFAQDSDASEIIAVGAPELVAMAWAIESETKTLDDVEFWTADGEPLNGLYRNEILSELTTQDLTATFPDGERLRPLAMIYRAVENAPLASVRSIMSNNDEAIAGAVVERPQNNAGFAVSIAAPLKAKRSDWPQFLDLVIRYTPVKSVSKTLDEDLMARKEVMENVWVTMTPTGSGEHQFNFECPMPEGPTPESFYEYSVEFLDGRVEKPEILCIVPTGSIRYLRRSTKPFQSDSVKSISVTKLVFAYEQIGKIRILSESLDDQ